MYGRYGDPAWAANDPYLNADKLRGLDLFSYGTIIEATVNYCTYHLAAKLNSLGIRATYDFRPVGTHSWGIGATPSTSPGRS
jgi:S-formylglutathione hydrolase FrmB